MARRRKHHIQIQSAHTETTTDYIKYDCLACPLHLNRFGQTVVSHRGLKSTSITNQRTRFASFTLAKVSLLVIVVVIFIALFHVVAVISNVHHLCIVPSAAGGSAAGCALGFGLHCDGSIQQIDGVLPKRTSHLFHKDVYNCDDSDKEASYLFVVRDPIDRLRSAFNYDRPEVGDDTSYYYRRFKPFYIDCPFWTVEGKFLSFSWMKIDVAQSLTFILSLVHQK